MVNYSRVQFVSIDYSVLLTKLTHTVHYGLKNVSGGTTKRELHTRGSIFFCFVLFRGDAELGMYLSRLIWITVKLI